MRPRYLSLINYKMKSFVLFFFPFPLSLSFSSREYLGKCNLFSYAYGTMTLNSAQTALETFLLDNALPCIVREKCFPQTSLVRIQAQKQLK